MTKVFEMDGDIFQVDTLALEREFVIEPSEHQSPALDGSFHWEPAGVRQLFHATFRARPGLEQELERLWEQLQLPCVHNCSFPYGQTLVHPWVYVTGCRQALGWARGSNCWDRLQVTFRCIEPQEDSL